MGVVKTQGDQAWRDKVAPGSAVDNEPSKSEIRAWVGTLDGFIQALLVASSGLVIKDTRANLYADLAHVAGVYGYVIADATVAYNGYYKKSGGSGTGSWTFVTQDPAKFYSDLAEGFANDAAASAAEAAEIAERFGDEVPVGTDVAVIGADGKSPVVVRDDGTLAAGRAAFRELEGMAGAGVPVNADVALAKGVDGGVPWLIDGQGVMRGKKLEVATINGDPVSSLGGFAGEGRFMCNVSFLPFYGQSLSIGTSTGGSNIGAVISGSQRFDNLRFNDGVRTQDGGSTRTSLVSLTETIGSADSGPTNAYGETPATGASDAIKELILADYSIAYTDQSYQILCSAPGQGGTPIGGLGLGQPPFTRMVADMTAGAALAATAGKTFKCLAMCWLQGESDIGNTTYATSLKAIRSNFSSAVATATGQTEAVIMITYDAPFGDLVAQYKLATDTDPLIYIMGGMYHIPRQPADVHLTAIGSKWIGAYMGRVYNRVVIDNTGWTPLKPISHFRQGKLAEVKFAVPVTPLQWDTTIHPSQTDYGFRLFAANGTTPIALSSVTITQPDTVRFTTAAAIPAGAILRYGFADPTDHTIAGMFGGNLFDSDPTVIGGGGYNFPLSNACICFQWTLS